MLRRMVWSGAFLALALVTLHAQRPTDLVNKRVTAQVVGVIAGDTVDILIPPARRLRVRLHGVDAPESGEPFSQQARAFTRVLIFSREVQVTGKDVDTYGRLVARIVVDVCNEYVCLGYLRVHGIRYRWSARYAGRISIQNWLDCCGIVALNDA